MANWKQWNTDSFQAQSCLFLFVVVFLHALVISGNSINLSVIPYFLEVWCSAEPKEAMVTDSLAYVPFAKVFVHLCEGEEAVTPKGKRVMKEQDL